MEAFPHSFYSITNYVSPETESIFYNVLDLNTLSLVKDPM